MKILTAYIIMGIIIGGLFGWIIYSILISASAVKEPCALFLIWVICWAVITITDNNGRHNG